MLCSIEDDNTSTPLTALNSVSNVIVINDEHWVIAGLVEGISANPKDYADEYLTQHRAEFLSVH